MRARFARFHKLLFQRTIHDRMDLVSLYGQFVKQGDLCFDVGANVGDRSAVLLRLGARVVAVEPQSSCVSTLRRRFKNDRRIILVNEAAGGNIGWGHIAICQAAPTISTMSTDWRQTGRFASTYTWPTEEKVRMTTLDELIRRHGLPKFCKIDVEGYEAQVLNGLTQPVQYLSFEFAIEFLETAFNNITHLGKLGSAGFNCVVGEAAAFVFPDWVASDTLKDYLRNQRYPDFWGDIYAFAE